MAGLVRALALGVLLAVLVLLFRISRYLAHMSYRRHAMDTAWASARQGPVPDGEPMPGSYVLYVLGSGGHTGELCAMIQQEFRPNPRSHRRYVVTSGDRHSEHIVDRLEGLIRQTFPASAAHSHPGGTWDVVHVVRARRVHQPLYTAWLTTLQSALSAVQALTRPPPLPRAPGPFGGEAPRGWAAYPDLIVTNGPGTGFVVCLVASVLKLLGAVPANRCAVLFVETWAHVRTLSLTGKLFYYAGIADLFVVQHAPLAAATGLRYVGDVAKHGNLLGIRKPWKPAAAPPS